MISVSSVQEYHTRNIMKICVTGGAGFIGTNYVYYIINHSDDEVVVLDSLTYAGNFNNLNKLSSNPRFRFYQIDIVNRGKLEEIFEVEKFDVVINFAAETHVDRSVEDPGVFLRTNILGTQNLMDLCLKYGNIRFHQVSTDEVYGDLPLDRPDLLFSENTPLHASSPYSASKAGADLLIMSYYRTFGLKATISRCSNNYGAYQFPEKLIPLMISRAINNENLPVYGNGLNVRDWLHVEDHCSAIKLIVEKGKLGETYNIGGNNEKTNLDVIRSILHYLNKSEELITFVSDRKGHDLRYAIDASKIISELGWKPTYNFDDGIKETIDWYLNNHEWLSDILNGDYRKYYEEMYGNK